MVADASVNIETTGTRLVYENRWMRVREDTIRRRDGSTGIYGVVEKPDFVVIVCRGRASSEASRPQSRDRDRRNWHHHQQRWDVAARGAILDTKPSDWIRNIEVNLFGPLYVLRRGVPFLPKGGVVTSGTAANPLVGWSAYCASKAGLSILTRVVQSRNQMLAVFVFMDSCRAFSIPTCRRSIERQPHQRGRQS